MKSIIERAKELGVIFESSKPKKVQVLDSLDFEAKQTIRDIETLKNKLNKLSGLIKEVEHEKLT